MTSVSNTNASKLSNADLPKSQSILSLGSDIVLFHILPNLNLADIDNLKKVPNRELYSILNSPAFYQVLFLKQFGSLNAAPFSANVVNWQQLYQLRSSSLLYAWGQNSNKRLGLESIDQPYERQTQSFNYPTKVNALHLKKTNYYLEIVDNPYITPVDISFTGFNLQVLTAKGNIFRFGSTYSWQGHRMASGNDYNPSKSLGNLLSVIKSEISEEEFYSKEVLAEQQSMDSKASLLRLPRTTNTKNLRLLSISAGRISVLALDSENQIWTWDTDEDMAVKVDFLDATGKSIVKNSLSMVTKILGGWNSSSCYINGIGIVVWVQREDLSWKKFPEGAVATVYSIVKGTGDTEGPNRVVDYMLGEAFVVFVTAAGLLYKVDYDEYNIRQLATAEPYPVVSFNKYLQKRSQGGETHRFIKVTGNFKGFAVFTNKDNVLIGNRDNISKAEFTDNYSSYSKKSEPEIHPEIQNSKCINVCFGDYHYLALMKNGDLYSWGTEPKSCGCLGLGSSDEIAEEHGENSVIEAPGNWRMKDITVPKPTKINLNGGVALAISAAGWQSAAIIVPQKGKEGLYKTIVMRGPNGEELPMRFNYVE